MKKIVLFNLFLVLILCSVFAAPKGICVPDTIDNSISEDQLSKVIINKLVLVKKIDEYANPYYANKFSKEPVFDKSLNDFLKLRTFYMLPGEHTFNFSFKTNVRMANSVDYTVTLEAGKTYELIAEEEEGFDVVFYDIQEVQTHTSLIPGVRLTYKQQLAIEYAGILDTVKENNLVFNSYIPNSYAFNLSYEELLKEYNNLQADYIIEYGPDMSVKYTEKGKEYDGFIGFDASNVVIYIKFNKDGKLTKEAFLDLAPEKCDRVFNLKSVTNTDGIIEINVTQKKGKETLSFRAK